MVTLVAGVLCMAMATHGEGPASVETERIFRGGSPCTFADLVAEAAGVDVVFLGEEHDHAEGHAFQLRLLEALGARAPRLVLSLEMFERDVQLPLDEYLRGFITESAFLSAARPWPRYATDYRPLVEWCRAHSRPVVAANVPRRYVNIVSRQGQAALLSLPRESRRYLPSLPYRMDISPAYDAALTEVFGTAHGGGAATGMPDPQRMKEAQGLWDHGMAESILLARRRLGGRPVVHVVGAMHCQQGFGIVERLRRASPRLRVLVVIVRPAPPDLEETPPNLGDFVVLCRPAKPDAPGSRQGATRPAGPPNPGPGWASASVPPREQAWNASWRNPPAGPAR